MTRRAGARFSKVPKTFRARKLFGPEKPFVKLRPAYSVKLVFSYVVKGIKIKITAKFCASRRLHFEDNRRIMAPEKFRDFRETGPWPFRKLLLQYEKKKGVEIKRMQFFVVIFLKTTTSRRGLKKISAPCLILLIRQETSKAFSIKVFQNSMHEFVGRGGGLSRHFLWRKRPSIV